MHGSQARVTDSSYNGILIPVRTSFGLRRRGSDTRNVSQHTLYGVQHQPYVIHYTFQHQEVH